MRARSSWRCRWRCARSQQLNAGEQVSLEYINRRELTAADIQEWRIKGVWYFDKRQGELKYRLLGLAPVAPDVNFIDSEQSDLVELFWVWFPSSRDILHEAKAFNNKKLYIANLDCNNHNFLQQ